MNTITLTAKNIKINNRKPSPRVLTILNFMLQNPTNFFELASLIDNLKAIGVTRGLTNPNMADTMTKLIGHGVILKPFNHSRIYKLDMNYINKLLEEGI